jgi:hypothetical protein
MQQRLPDDLDAVTLLVGFVESEGEECRWLLRPTLAHARGRFALLSADPATTSSKDSA